MPYATRQDLADRYGEAEVSQRESALPDGGLDRCLADADAEVDSYLAGKYVVPLSPAPGRVVRVASAIARYFLLGPAADEIARRDYKDARAWLLDVQAGRAVIEGVSTAGGAAPGALAEVVNGRPSAFGGGLL